MSQEVEEDAVVEYHRTPQMDISDGISVKPLLEGQSGQEKHKEAGQSSEHSKGDEDREEGQGLRSAGYIHGSEGNDDTSSTSSYARLKKKYLDDESLNSPSIHSICSGQLEDIEDKRVRASEEYDWKHSRLRH